VVEILLGRDIVKLDRPEAFEETLLSHSKNSHKGMVKILLERDDVDLTDRISTTKIGSLALLRMGTREL